jgi:hypothetical protein
LFFFPHFFFPATPCVVARGRQFIFSVTSVICQRPKKRQGQIVPRYFCRCFRISNSTRRETPKKVIKKNRENNQFFFCNSFLTRFVFEKSSTCIFCKSVLTVFLTPHYQEMPQNIPIKKPRKHYVCRTK